MKIKFLLILVIKYAYFVDNQKYWSPLVGAYGYFWGLAPYNNAPGTGQTAKQSPQPVQSAVISGL